MRLLGPATLLVLAACQEYGLAGGKDDDPPAEVDSDVGLPSDQPDIVVTPASLDFGTFAPGCASEPQVVELANTGTADLVVSAIDLAGADVAAFTTDAAPLRLRPGERRAFTVTFTASAIQPYGDARVEVASNDPDEPLVGVELDGEGADQTIREDLFTQEPVEKVDVLFVLDNSTSMSGEVLTLASGLADFAAAFLALGVDWQWAVITTDMRSANAKGRFRGPIITPATQPSPTSEFLDQADVGSFGSDTERGYDAAVAALTPPLSTNENAGFLRTDAALAVVHASDEEDSSNLSARDYIDFLRGLKPDPNLVSFNGIVGPEQDQGGVNPDTACVQVQTDLDAAPTHHRIIRATGGAWGDLCDFDAYDFVQDLALTASGIRSTFVLSGTPDGGASGIEVTVGGQPVAQGARNGWTYDRATNTVTLNGSSRPGQGEAVVIAYPVAGGCG